MKKIYYGFALVIIVIITAIIIIFSTQRPMKDVGLSMEADSLMQSALVAMNTDSFTLAFNNLQRAQSIYSDLNDSTKEMSARSYISVIYYAIGLYKEAVNEMNIVRENIHLLDTLTLLNHYRGSAIIETVINKNYINAIDIMKKLISIEHEIGRKNSEIQDYSNLAEVYLYAKQYDGVAETLEKIKTLAEENNTKLSSQFYLCKGKLNLNLGKYDDAYESLKYCISPATLYYQPHIKLEALGLLCAIDSMRNDKDSYISNIREHIQLNDSLNGRNIVGRVMRLQEQQRIEIEKVKDENNYKISRTYNIVTTIIAILIIIISILVYLHSRYQLRIVQLETERLDNDIMHQREQNKLLLQKISESDKEMDEIKQNNLSMSLQLASMQEHTAINLLQQFDEIYSKLNDSFGQALRSKYPNLTSTELRYLCLIKLGMTSQEIMSVQHVSQASIYKMRYRLKKKLELETSSSLENFVASIK